MECPKCGTSQPDGREQCSRCGIVFERWRAHQERMQLMQRRTLSSPPAPERSHIPLPILIVGAVFVVILGLLWTKHHYEAAKKAENADILNDINQRALRRPRFRLGESSPTQTPSPTEQAPPPPIPAPASLSFPPDLPEDRARAIIENCRFFQDSPTFDIPRQFPRESYQEVAQHYPALQTAAREQLIELRPRPGSPPDPTDPDDLIRVSITPEAYSRATVMDSGGDMFQLGYGRRHLESLWVADTKYIGRVTLSFTWTYDKPAGAALSGDPQRHTGGMILHQDQGNWSLRYGWIDSRQGGQFVCP